jgi:hypothetical protein
MFSCPRLLFTPAQLVRNDQRYILQTINKVVFKDKKLILGTATRPKLGDKTPLPNRTLIPQSPSEKVKALKTSTLRFTNLPDSLTDDEDADVLESMKRPSSLRKHLKLPKNSTPKDFETPMNYGRHWEVSDGDIDVSNLQSALQEVKVVEDDIGSDEVEYCAPNTLGSELVLSITFFSDNTITRFTVSASFRLRVT